MRLAAILAVALITATACFGGDSTPELIGRGLPDRTVQKSHSQD